MTERLAIAALALAVAALTIVVAWFVARDDLERDMRSTL